MDSKRIPPLKQKPPADRSNARIKKLLVSMRKISQFPSGFPAVFPSGFPVFSGGFSGQFSGSLSDHSRNSGRLPPLYISVAGLKETIIEFVLFVEM